MSVEIKADIRHWLRELDKKYFFVMLGFAVMVYFPLISLKLTNTVDGLWTTAEYMAGAWELSNGRWFWLVTSFLRFSLQLEPINAVVCLVLVSLGVTRLHMLFKPAWMRTSCIDWLAGLCYVSNVVVGCYLSFHFIAPEYGFSFFFAMLATEHVIRGKSAVSSIVPAAVLLALSLGLYQTNLACFCLVLLAYFLLLLFQNGEKQKWRKTKDSGIYLQKPGKCCIRRSAVSADLKDYTVGDGNGDGRLPGWCRYFSVWNSEKSSFQR